MQDKFTLIKSYFEFKYEMMKARMQHYHKIPSIENLK